MTFADALAGIKRPVTVVGDTKGEVYLRDAIGFPLGSLNRIADNYLIAALVNDGPRVLALLMSVSGRQPLPQAGGIELLAAEQEEAESILAHLDAVMKEE